MSSSGLRVVRFGDWTESQRILKQGMRPVYRALGRAWNAEAKFLRSKLQSGIRSQAPGGRKFKTLAPTTLAIRKFLGFGGTKALLGQHKELIKAIKVTKFGRLGSRNYEVFVGILAGAVGNYNRYLYRTARLNEYGSKPIVIRLTPKARRFFFAAMRARSRRKWMGSRGFLSGRSSGFVVVRIPPRPVFEPVWRAFGTSARSRIMSVLERDLRGIYS